MTASGEPARPGPGTPRRPRWRPVVTAAAITATLAATLAAQAAGPDYEERFHPVVSAGEAGRNVTTRDFDIRVDRVELARSLVHVDYQEKPVDIEVPAREVFVVVSATVTSRRLPMRISGAYLAAEDGTRTLFTDRVQLASLEKVGVGTSDSTQPLDNSYDALKPLVPSHLRFAFEVPESRVRGAHLWVSVGRMEWKGDLQAQDWFRPQARIDLGIGAAEARRLLASAIRRYRVEQP